MAGETVVEQPQDNNTKVDEPVKTDKEVIAEEEAAQAEVSLENKYIRMKIHLSDVWILNCCRRELTFRNILSFILG